MAVMLHPGEIIPEFFSGVTYEKAGIRAYVWERAEKKTIPIWRGNVIFPDASFGQGIRNLSNQIQRSSPFTVGRNGLNDLALVMWKALGFQLLLDRNAWSHQDRTLLEFVAAVEKDACRIGEERDDSSGAATDAPTDRGFEAPSAINTNSEAGTSVTD